MPTGPVNTGITFLEQARVEAPGDDFPLCRIKLVERLYWMNTQFFPQIHGGIPLPHLTDLEVPWVYSIPSILIQPLIAPANLSLIPYLQSVKREAKFN